MCRNCLANIARERDTMHLKQFFKGHLIHGINFCTQGQDSVFVWCWSLLYWPSKAESRMKVGPFCHFMGIELFKSSHDHDRGSSGVWKRGCPKIWWTYLREFQHWYIIANTIEEIGESALKIFISWLIGMRNSSLIYPFNHQTSTEANSGMEK